MKEFKKHPPLAYQFVNPQPTSSGGTTPGKRKVEEAAIQNVQAMLAGGYEPDGETISKAIDVAVLTMKELENRFGCFENIQDLEREERELNV